MAKPALKAIESGLQAGKIVLLDGATGTELERRGVAMHHAAWCAMATLTDPDQVRTVHEDYIRAGARIVTTNTFSTNRIMLEPAGLGDRFGELNRRAVELAMEARERTETAERVAVAGSMSHQVPMVAGSDQRDSRAVPAPEVAGEWFEEMAAVLAQGGVDLILMEMMSDPDLARPAISAALATGLPVWVGFSVRAGESGELLSYARPELPVAEMLRMLPLDGVQVAGVMHSNVTTIGPMIEELKRSWQGPLMVYPDSGYARMPHWQFVDIIPPGEFAACGRDWIAAGVQVLGGCCGLGVEHIRALAGVVAEHGDQR